MIKDEKMLNAILNEIAIGEKENFRDNISDSNMVDDSTFVSDQDDKTNVENDSPSPESIHFNAVITLPNKEYPSNHLSDDMAINIKQLLFNSTCRTWGSEWYRQNFEFYPIDSDIPFGLIQRSQGPNNILAVVQAEFLVESLFCTDININWISNVKRNRNQLLAYSLSRVIGRCRKSESDSYKVCLLDINLKGRSMGVVKPDGIIECMVFYEVTNKEELKKFILLNINQFADLHNPGLILLVMSCLMTCGMPYCKNYPNVNRNRLISPLGYADDELMNLLIHGTISPHYFNDHVNVVDPKSGKSTVHCGISKRSSIGFLTNEVHCEFCVEIGTYLKTPRYPVWIIKWRNSTYLVLYCHNRTLISDWKTEIRFRIHLYSPLFKIPKLVSMVIDSSQSQMENQKLYEKEIKSKIEAEKSFQKLTENRLKNMSASTLKFLLDDGSIEGYMGDDVEDLLTMDSDLDYLERIIHIKWPNATVILDDDQFDVTNLFRH